jgi:hypothetical protein
MAQYQLSMPGCTKFEITQWLRWILKERSRFLANFVCGVDGSREEGFVTGGGGEMGIRTEFWSGNLGGRNHTGGL